MKSHSRERIFIAFRQLRAADADQGFQELFHGVPSVFTIQKETFSDENISSVLHDPAEDPTETYYIPFFEKRQYSNNQNSRLEIKTAGFHEGKPACFVSISPSRSRADRSAVRVREQGPEAEHRG